MTIKIVKKPQSPKTYKKPRILSLDALGLLTHMRLHQDSDGNYSWGVMKTAEHFGIDHRRIREAYKELDKAGQTTTIQSGKDPDTGKNLLVIVKPFAKNPVAYMSVELSPLELSSGISAPLDIVRIQESSRSVSHSLLNKNVVSSGTIATGSANPELRRLDEEIQQAEASLAEAQKAARETVAKFGDDGGWSQSIKNHKDHLAKLRNRRDVIEAESEQ